jgi:hypothetical protein
MEPVLGFQMAKVGEAVDEALGPIGGAITLWTTMPDAVERGG